MNDILKICGKHGALKLKDVRRDSNLNGNKYLRCKFCRIETDRKWKLRNKEKHIAGSSRWKKENREKVNAWLRQDRKNNPEKYRKYEANKIAKYGIEKYRAAEVRRIHGLTEAAYNAMFETQNHRCKICGLEETRKSRTGIEVTKLCVDHCHVSKKVRGLLCAACNKGLGHFKDSVELLEKAVNYIKGFDDEILNE